MVGFDGSVTIDAHVHRQHPNLISFVSALTEFTTLQMVKVIIRDINLTTAIINSVDICTACKIVYLCR